MKTFTTPKGTTVPLLNLRGKEYLMGAYRLLWMNEEVPSFEINTEFVLLTEDQTIARATVILCDKDGKIIKKATATKRETKKDFPDHTEKAESSAIFRALAMLGFGTQYALADLDEGERIVDTPLAKVAEAPKAEAVEIKKSSFKKAPKKEEMVAQPAPVTAPAVAAATGWE